MKVMTAAWALPLLGFCGAVSCGVSESVTPSASGTDDAASDTLATALMTNDATLLTRDEAQTADVRVPTTNYGSE